MKQREFKKLSIEHFGGLLCHMGFDIQKRYGPTYYRINAAGIYHFVMPQISRHGNWFDIMVFANSSHINHEFETNFETGIDVPSDINSFLDPILGVSWRHKPYKCKTEEQFLSSFKNEVEPALLQFGLPFLDTINTVSDLIKTVHPQVAHIYNLSGTGT